MSNAFFLVDGGVGGTRILLSRFLFSTKCRSCERQAIGRERERERKKTKREREKIYVPGIFFRATTTLTAYKMLAKRVWVSCESADRVDSTTSSKDVPLDARDDVNVRKDALSRWRWRNPKEMSIPVIPLTSYPSSGEVSRLSTKYYMYIFFSVFFSLFLQALSIFIIHFWEQTRSKFPKKNCRNIGSIDTRLFLIEEIEIFSPPSLPNLIQWSWPLRHLPTFIRSVSIKGYGCIAELKHLHHRESREEALLSETDKEASQRVENIGDKSVYHFWSTSLVSLLVSFENFRASIVKYRKDLRMPRLLATQSRSPYFVIILCHFYFFFYFYSRFQNGYFYDSDEMRSGGSSISSCKHQIELLIQRTRTGSS